MTQASDTNSTPATESKAATTMETAMAAAKPAKGKQSAKANTKQAAAPARPAVMQGQRTVVTFETAARICPNEAVASKISRMYGLDAVDYHAVREATEEHLAVSAKVLVDNLGERPDKALEMHMQRIVDGFVRSAHGAGNFYDNKAAEARRATSAIANDDRDEDRHGIDGLQNRAQRACEFAATVGLQAYALLAAAHGAVDAYAHVCGQDWKPYEGMQAPSQAITRKAIAIRASAFSKE